MVAEYVSLFLYVHKMIASAKTEANSLIMESYTALNNLNIIQLVISPAMPRDGLP